MKGMLAPALLLILAACAGNPKKPSSSAEALVEADRAHAEALPSSPVLDAACAPTRAHRDSDYTRGGLYAPGVADGRPEHEIDVSAVTEPEARREPRAALG